MGQSLYTTNYANKREKKAEQLIRLNSLTIEISCEMPIPENVINAFVNHMKNKPKSFSSYNWGFPLLYYLNESKNRTYEENEKIALRIWNEYSQWQKSMKPISYTLKFSTSEKVMTRCFNSKHFNSCGKIGGFNQYLAIQNIHSKNISVAYIEDKAGNIISRTFLCLDLEGKIGYYMIYSNNRIVPSTQIEQKLLELNLYPMGRTIF